MNETNIITAVCAGDIDQYAELVEKYQAGLILHCERMTGDRDEAEDIAQKAFLKAYQKLETFDVERARFSTWLYKIATNMAIDLLRTNKRTIPTEMETIETLAPVYMTMEKSELIDEMRAAVLSLTSAEHRQAVEAYYWQGKSYLEIAAEMDVSINTVKSWLRRAKQQLRKDLS